MYMACGLKSWYILQFSISSLLFQNQTPCIFVNNKLLKITKKQTFSTFSTNWKMKNLGSISVKFDRSWKAFLYCLNWFVYFREIVNTELKIQCVPNLTRQMRISKSTVNIGEVRWKIAHYWVLENEWRSA